MRRAKQPPPPELVNECSVIADMLDLDARDQIVDCPSLGIGTVREQHVANFLSGAKLTSADRILMTLTLRAMEQYLRLFQKARKPNFDPWVVMPTVEKIAYDGSKDLEDQLTRMPGLTVGKAKSTYIQEVSTGEYDYQCFFCRKSLHTQPIKQRFPRGGKLHQKLLRHTEKCAVRMLAGLMKPHPPLPKGQPGL